MKKLWGVRVDGNRWLRVGKQTLRAKCQELLLPHITRIKTPADKSDYRCARMPVR